LIVNKRQLSQILAVSEETITQWQRDSNFPIESRSKGQKGNQYDTGAVIAWLKKREVDNLMVNTSAIDIEEAKRRKIAAEAGLAELELAKEQGTVVLVEDVADEFAEQVSALRAKLLSMPSKLGSLIFTAKDVTEAKEILENAMLEALNELVGYRETETERDFAEGVSESLEGETEAAA